MSETDAGKNAAPTSAEPDEAEPDDQIVHDLNHVQIGLSADDEEVDIVDWASDNSFPASDPPPWTPGIG